MRTKTEQPAAMRLDLLVPANDVDAELALPPKRPPAPSVVRRPQQHPRLN
jgi:hypothetical protein